MATTDAEILELARQRVRPLEIASRLGVTRETVYQCLSHARRRGEQVPTFNKTPRKRQLRAASGDETVALSNFMLVCLEKPARLRGLTVAQLADRLLDQLAEEPALIDAVLDDRPEAATVTETTKEKRP